MSPGPPPPPPHPPPRPSPLHLPSHPPFKWRSPLSVSCTHMERLRWRSPCSSSPTTASARLESCSGWGGMEGHGVLQ